MKDELKSIAMVFNGPNGEKELHWFHEVDPGERPAGWSETRLFEAATQATADNAQIAALTAERDAMREQLLTIAKGEYDDLAGNPTKWACMIARQFLGLPLQGVEFRAALKTTEAEE